MFLVNPTYLSHSIEVSYMKREIVVKTKYLRYWWEPNSEVDPQKSVDEYFHVHYDMWRRPVLVERYGPERGLISSSKFTWKWNKLTRSESYDPEGKMKFYNIYRYGRLGNLLRVEHYSPDGHLLRFEEEGI